jgi:preprotein translocase subunit SecE
MSKSDQRGKKRAARKEAAEQPAAQTASASQEKSPREEKKKNLAVAKKESDKRTGGDGNLLKYVKISLQFLRESKVELKKVKWPTRKELLASTAVVIALVLVVSFFLGIIDFGLIKIIKTIVG